MTDMVDSRRVTFRMSGQAWDLVEESGGYLEQSEVLLWDKAKAHAIPMTTGRGMSYWIAVNDLRVAYWLLGFFRGYTGRVNRNTPLVIREAISRIEDALDGREVPNA